MDRPSGPVNCGCDVAERTYAELERYCDGIADELDAARARIAELEDVIHEYLAVPEDAYEQEAHAYNALLAAVVR